MPTRNAEAEWKGNLMEGAGQISLGSGAWSGPYNWRSRAGDGADTNPEELIAAAHAGCFTMALTATLGRQNIVPNRVHTTAKVHLEKQEAGFAIPKIELFTEAEIPGIDDATFQEAANSAKVNCPVSKALAGPEIILTAKLV